MRKCQATSEQQSPARHAAGPRDPSGGAGVGEDGARAEGGSSARCAGKDEHGGSSAFHLATLLLRRRRPRAAASSGLRGRRQLPAPRRAEAPAGSGPRASTRASSPAGPALSAAGAAPGPSRLPAPSHTCGPRADRRAADREWARGGRRRGDSSCDTGEPDSPHHHIKEAAIFPGPQCTALRAAAWDKPGGRGPAAVTMVTARPVTGLARAGGAGSLPGAPPREPQGLNQAAHPRAGGDRLGERPRLPRPFPGRARPRDVGGAQCPPARGAARAVGGHPRLGGFAAAGGETAFLRQNRHPRDPSPRGGPGRRERGRAAAGLPGAGRGRRVQRCCTQRPKGQDFILPLLTAPASCLAAKGFHTGSRVAPCPRFLQGFFPPDYLWGAGK